MNFVVVFWSFCLTFQTLYTKVESRAIMVVNQELGSNNTEILEEFYMQMSKNISQRGLVDILENFRLWQLERQKANPTTSKPTKEPMGLQVFLPRIPEIKIDEKTLVMLTKGLEHAAQDIVKSFAGPPSTKPPPKLPPNVSAKPPENELFCFLC